MSYFTYHNDNEILFKLLHCSTLRGVLATPEYRCLVAILDRAIEDLKGNAATGPYCEQENIHCRMQALGWFTSRDDSVFSFTEICNYLGLNRIEALNVLGDAGLLEDHLLDLTDRAEVA